MYVKIYTGDSMECVCPSHFTSSYRDFANQICGQSTSYASIYSQQDYEEDDKPSENAKRETARSLYLWIPAIFMLMALSLIIPHIVWIVLSRCSVLNLDAILNAGRRGHYPSCETERTSTLSYITGHLDSIMTGKSRFMLAVFFVLTKLWYIILCYGQMIFIEWFLGLERHPYSLLNLIAGDYFGEGHLPDQILCKLTIYGQSVQHFTLPCALKFALFLGQTLKLLWSLFGCLLLLNFYSLMAWCVRCFCRPWQRGYVSGLLSAMEKLSRNSKSDQAVTNFFGNRLNTDVIFTLRLLAANTDDAFTAEILAALFDLFQSSTPGKNQAIPTITDNSMGRPVIHLHGSTRSLHDESTQESTAFNGGGHNYPMITS